MEIDTWEKSHVKIEAETEVMHPRETSAAAKDYWKLLPAQREASSRPELRAFRRN